MTNRPPAEPGMRLEDVDTPALIIDLDAFEANLARMAADAAAAGMALRPHAKMHKCPTIGLKQMALGAVGMCCQKVSEAEAMVNGGIPDVLVSNQVVGAPKIARLASLATRARVGVCVDDLENVDQLSAAAEAFGVDFEVLIEISLGRCGVEPGEAATALAKRIERAPRLRFGGLHVYHGGAQHIRERDERREAVDYAAGRARAAKEGIEAAGVAVPRVTGAGTGTYEFESASGVYNELQCGSYAFMDADYSRNRNEGGAPYDRFEQSLFVYATVMSRPAPDRAVCDAGLKASSVDSGLPLVADADLDAEYTGASDEHGTMRLGSSNRTLKLGDKIKLIPGHCDPTVNLYDWYVGVRDGRVEAVWPISARGCMT
ncbi:MAG: DSD1 family PLP-dependent enzyme [Rhodospirillaceae bacterium]|jgi:3-hydroxy-D-aspartate aldolase|nr:DSD1 family PLP-dependent enzyme [Rhodospirillaceae bacterium]MBT6119210.1 DSD1 family PLP-dependent enzyme [Rhodospirillaceae bacterium]